MSGGFQVWRGTRLDEVLSRFSRQYLVGNLKRPQEVGFRTDDRLEVGITSYVEPSVEEPHGHSEATEFQYMLSGQTEYLDVDTGEEFTFVAGDFYSISSPTRYAQRSKAGTRILFIKVPSANDKIPVPRDPTTDAWLATPVTTTRTDYFHSHQAPAANSLRPAAAVAVLDEESRILLLRRRDSGNWTMPGGTQEHGESLPSAAVREFSEETGLSIELTGIIGTYTDPDVRIAYTDGEVRQEFTVVFAGRLESGQVRIDEESTGYDWLHLDDLDQLPLADSQRRRLTDVQRYVASGTQAIH